jgi:hypothetical protein
MPVVYTTIFSNYDDLKRPLIITPGWKYLCFTDQPFKSDVWEILPCTADDPRQESKFYKIFNHPNERSIYIDGSFIINCDLNKFYNKYYKGKVSIMKHPYRNCVYQEIAECGRLGKDNTERLASAKEILHSAGVKANSGLAASGIILRNGEHVFTNYWYKCLDISSRDQISWALANRKYPGLCSLFDYDYRTGTDFLFVPHNGNAEKKAAKLFFYQKQGII